MSDDSAGVGPVEPTVRPRAWMAQHGREPVQATVSQQQAEAWAQAGGDVVELYDGPTLWNAIATADARRRELQAQIERLRATLDACMASRDALRDWAQECRDQVLYLLAQQNNELGRVADGLGQASAGLLGSNPIVARVRG